MDLQIDWTAVIIFMIGWLFPTPARLFFSLNSKNSLNERVVRLETRLIEKPPDV